MQKYYLRKCLSDKHIYLKFTSSQQNHSKYKIPTPRLISNLSLKTIKDSAICIKIGTYTYVGLP